MLGDTSLRLLANLTERPVASVASLERGIRIGSGVEEAVDGFLCFRDLHLGLDPRQTSTGFALGRLPRHLDPESPEGRQAIGWQQMLSVQLVDQPTSLPVPLPPGVLFIKRLQTRKFKNFIDLKSIARKVVKAASDGVLATTTSTTTMSATGVPTTPTVSGVVFPSDWKGWTNELIPERMDFSEQVTKLRGATVVVAVHGQGAANALFMRPGSSLVLIVPPKFDGEKYLFANMAVASGVHTFLVENEGKANSTELNATLDQRLQWLDEAKHEKDTWVDPVGFGQVLRLAVALASAPPSEEPARIHSFEEALREAADEEAKAKAADEEAKAKAAEEAAKAKATTEAAAAEEDKTSKVGDHEQKPNDMATKAGDNRAVDPEQTPEVLQILQEIEQAKAKVTALESKLTAMRPATKEEL